MTIPTPKFAAEVHANAVAKGFWPEGCTEDPDFYDACVELIHCEIAEAAECVRKGQKGVMYLGYDGTVFFTDSPGTLRKPVGLPVEIADVVLRTLDVMAGYDGVYERGVRLSDLHRVDTNEAAVNVSSARATLASLRRLTHCIGNLDEHDDFVSLLSYCYAFARAFDFDLDDVVRQKHQYNLTRPHKHGRLA